MTHDSKVIYKYLKNQIITLELKPGTRLSETEISKQFGISRTPLRDILKKLEYDGLVVIKPHKGNFVTKIDINNLSDIMYIRSRVDTGILVDLMDKITAGEIAILENILYTQKQIIDEKSIDPHKVAELFFKNDNDFHKNLYKLAGKPALWDVVNSLSPAYSRFRYISYLRDFDNLLYLYQSHANIISQLKKKDYTNIRHTIEDHAFSGLRGIRKVQEKHSDYFASQKGDL